MRRIEITNGIMEPYVDVPVGTIVRFHFTDRWESHGLPDSYVEVQFSRDKDGIQLRSHPGGLTIGPEVSNSLIVAPMDMYGGEAEVLRLRREKLDLVQRLNEAQDVYGTRKKELNSRTRTRHSRNRAKEGK